MQKSKFGVFILIAKLFTEIQNQGRSIGALRTYHQARIENYGNDRKAEQN